MITKEQYEKISMCALALRDGKKLRRKIYNGKWGISNNDLKGIVSNILNGWTYEVKPEPKTLQYRVYLAKNSFTTHFVKCAVTDSNGDWPVCDFVKWLTDVETVELPE